VPSLSKRIRNKLAHWRGIEPPLDLTAQHFPEFAIGRGTYGHPRVFRYPNDGNLRIGAYCSIAADVSIFLGGEHHPEWVSTFPFGALWREHEHPEQPRSRGDVVIGNDVWIGREAMIMSGVTIGDGAVIGARALVAKDVPAYTVAGGNPARPIRPRFAPDVVDRLLAIRWWNWPDERIRRAAPMLQSPDMATFIAAVEEGRI
jgi:chloramphenicol O-acetyltransferase type B